MVKLKISKYLSYILRHHPEAIGSSLDEEGYLKIDLDELIKRMKTKKKFQGAPLNKSLLMEVVNEDSKGRYQITGNKIRAKYGHSIDGISIFLTENELPSVLFHGTPKKNLDNILIEGLKPMGRNLVHLTENETDALNVGRRHGKDVIMLKIDVQDALKENIKFWKPGKNVYTAKSIPGKFITIKEKNGN